jgi:hypothetical protein
LATSLSASLVAISMNRLACNPENRYIGGNQESLRMDIAQRRISQIASRHSGAEAST